MEIDVKNSIAREFIFSNCMDCPNHSVQNDPDPHDWFCDDDLKVVCLLSRQDITWSCRPYNLRKECDTPEWCKLIKK